MIIIIAVFRANYIVLKPRHIISSALCFFFLQILINKVPCRILVLLRPEPHERDERSYL